MGQKSDGRLLRNGALGGGIALHAKLVPICISSLLTLITDRGFLEFVEFTFNITNSYTFHPAVQRNL